MNIYLHPNGVKKELKNDYIWEVYEYSYTFKWKTVSEITSEWTSLIWGVAVNSDWATWIGQNNDLRIWKSIPSLDTAKKIIISWTVVANNPTQNAWQLTISMGTWWGVGETGYQVYGSYFNWIKVMYGDGSTQYFWNKVGDAVSGSTYKPKTTIDLENKIITWELSWFSNSTLALTDTQINHIRQFDKLVCYVASTWSTISDVSITIEY